MAQLKAHQADRAKTELLDSTLATTMIAIQGPQARSVLQRVCEAPLDELGYYRSLSAEVAGAKCVVSRTGYTGEDGFEISFDNAMAVGVWNALLEAGRPEGIAACGLGARDNPPIRSCDASLRS